MATRNAVVLVSGQLQELNAPTDVLPSNTIVPSFAANVFAVYDNVDNTKIFNLNVSGVTTLTTRTWSIPDVNDTFVGLAATQTLTNKTLTSPVINVGSDATGDIYYRSAGGVFTRLPAGTNGHVLTLAAGIPSWAAPASGITIGTTAITSGTTEYFLFNNAGVVGNADELRRDAASGRIEVDHGVASGAAFYARNSDATGFYAILAETSYSNAQTARFIANGTSAQAFSSATFGNTATANAFIVQRYGSGGTAVANRLGYFSQNYNGGTPAAGFGAYLTFGLKTTTTDDVEAARFGWRWTDPTNGASQSEIYFSAQIAGSLTEYMTLGPTNGMRVYTNISAQGNQIYNFIASVTVVAGTTYTALAAESGTVYWFTNAANITFTIPGTLNSGWHATAVQVGAGQIITATNGSGVLRNNIGATDSAGQWAVMSIVKQGNDIVIGGATA